MIMWWFKAVGNTACHEGAIEAISFDAALTEAKRLAALIPPECGGPMHVEHLERMAKATREDWRRYGANV